MKVKNVYVVDASEFYGAVELLELDNNVWFTRNRNYLTQITALDALSMLDKTAQKPYTELTPYAIGPDDPEYKAKVEQYKKRLGL